MHDKLLRYILPYRYDWKHCNSAALRQLDLEDDVNWLAYIGFWC